MEILDAVVSTASQVATRVGPPLAALGLTTQRETIVAWDRRTGAPRHAALGWQDRRTAARCVELDAAGHGPAIRRTTGLVLDPYFSATKAEWLLGPGGVSTDADLALGTVDSWLLWNLSGGPGKGLHATDATSACRTMLFDLDAGRWSSELTELFATPPGSLAEIRPTTGPFAAVGSEFGALAGVPVAAMVGDQQAALYGQGCRHRGQVKATYGTGSFVLAHTGPQRPHDVEGLLITVACNADGSNGYALEGSVFVAGAAVQWLRDGLGIIGSAPEVEALASLAGEDAGGVVVVPAFTGLGSPWWDPDARGAVLGLTRGSGRAQLARAVLDAIAHQVRDVVDAMTAGAHLDVERLRVDGGAATDELLLSLQADQLGVPVERLATAEATALGAALLAGMAVGVWGHPDDATDAGHIDLVVEPTRERSEADREHLRWLDALERVRGSRG